MSPAVRRALAYCLATGSLPKGIHLGTWSRCFDMIEGDTLAQRPKPEHVAEVLKDGQARAHLYLVALGFQVERGRRRTGHYVSYTNPHDGREALAYRGGGGSITVVRDSVPYRQSSHFTDSDVGEALARLDESRAWPHWERLARLYAGACYSEGAAMSWHAAGRTAADYGAAMRSPIIPPMVEAVQV